MIIKPKIRGFICTTSHPQGCVSNVYRQIQYVKSHANQNYGPKRVLVIGASTGYGLASRISAAFGCGADTIGVLFEKEASVKRTASAGWYNTAAFETAAQQEGLYAKSINGDAFSDNIKQQVVDLVKQDWQDGVDLVIYSLASPRRQHPKTGEVYNSVLKTTGGTYKNTTVNILTGELSEVTIEPANQKEIDDTVAVMGGEDWAMWIDILIKNNVLAPGAMTVNYSYIGPELTYPIYRHGTIGCAKEDMEKTAVDLNEKLQQHCQGKALVSVNKGLVTQASAAIPVVPLYISLLYKAMKEKGTHEGCIEQIWRLFSERLYTGGEIPVDVENRIRIDDWEMEPEVQSYINTSWSKLSADNIEEMTDLAGYRKDFYQLFGFEVDGIDYDVDVDVEMEIPSIIS